VIAVTHDMEFVAELFDRVVVMRAGRAILDGSPGEAFGAGRRDLLRSTNLEAPLAARLAARLGLGSVVTEADLVSALAASARPAQ
jgi:energy-coupling factor transport system ATP-binding protein